MRKTFWYILGGQLATISIPAFAQDVGDDGAAPPADAQPSAPMMTPDQMATVDTWPADQQAQFRQWPGEVQTYFWSLAPERQDVFWRLTDGDKVALASMDDAGQAAAWARIDAQLANPAETAPVDNPPMPSEDSPAAAPVDDTAMPPEDSSAAADPAAEDGYDDSGVEDEAPEVPEPMGRA